MSRNLANEIVSDLRVARGAPFDPASVTRPDPRLMTYYTIVAALTLIAFPITFIPLWIRYHTLRYRFDEEGVGMQVGILFKRETYLTYRRIQDIHVTRGLLQRWMGLATVAVQTAAGASSAEMTIDGVADPDGLRDWLYSKMRGVADHAAEPSSAARPQDESLAILREIRDELHSLRERSAS
ncbi:MAG: PH domain-containing protein [Phycisphaerae bacterium]|nr:PH domain-containing protein [Phycisphaerae bacterium]